MMKRMGSKEVKEIRKSLGLTAIGLARLLGVTDNTVYRWEMGVRSPSGSAAILLRGLLNGNGRKQRLATAKQP